MNEDTGVRPVWIFHIAGFEKASATTFGPGVVPVGIGGVELPNAMDMARQAGFPVSFPLSLGGSPGPFTYHAAMLGYQLRQDWVMRLTSGRHVFPPNLI